MILIYLDSIYYDFLGKVTELCIGILINFYQYL